MRMVPIIAAAVLVGTARAHAQVEVGHVADVRALPGAVIVRAGGGTIPVALLAPLYAGDSILVRSDSTQVVVKVGEEAPRWLCRAGANKACRNAVAWRAGSRASPPNPIVVALRQSGAWVSAALFGQSDAGLAHAVLPRGDALSLPLIELRQAKRVAGTSVLELPWSGGEAPFRVRIYRLDPPSGLFEADGLTDHVVRSGPVELLPGRHAVEVRDATNHSASATFTVVAARELPRPPAGEAAASTTTSRVLQAAWLAAQEGGAWAWQAYEQLGVAPGADGGEAVASVRRALAAGQLPPP